MLAAVDSSENWPEAAIAIAGITLVGSVIIIAVWQLLATLRTKMTGSRESDYRNLAQQAIETQARITARLDDALTEIRALREQLGPSRNDPHVS